MISLPNNKTITDHNLRAKLKLSLEEYVFLDFLYFFGKEKLTFELAYKKTGLLVEEIKSTIKSLNEKQLICKNANGKWITSQTWSENFNKGNEFEEFWEIFKKKGNKQDAIKNYEKARKIVEKDVLFKAAKKYVNSVSDITYIMHASRWLNPTNKHWENVIETKEETNKTKIEYEGTFIKRKTQ